MLLETKQNTYYVEDSQILSVLDKPPSKYMFFCFFMFIFFNPSDALLQAHLIGLVLGNESNYLMLRTCSWLCAWYLLLHVFWKKNHGLLYVEHMLSAYLSVLCYLFDEDRINM